MAVSLSEVSRGIKNVLVENCTFLGTDVGVRIKSALGRGGVIENINVKNINMVDIKEQAIILTMSYVLNLLNRNEEINGIDKDDIILRMLILKELTALEQRKRLLLNR